MTPKIGFNNFRTMELARMSSWDFPSVHGTLVGHVQTWWPQTRLSCHYPPCLNFMRRKKFSAHLVLISFNVFRSFEEMEICLTPLKPSCSKVERSMFEGAESTSSFICREGKSGELQGREYCVHCQLKPFEQSHLDFMSRRFMISKFEPHPKSLPVCFRQQFETCFSVKISICFADFLRFRKCFVQFEVEAEGKLCNKTFALQMHEALDTRKPIKVRRELVCRYLEPQYCANQRPQSAAESGAKWCWKPGF